MTCKPEPKTKTKLDRLMPSKFMCDKCYLGHIGWVFWHESSKRVALRPLVAGIVITNGLVRCPVCDCYREFKNEWYPKSELEKQWAKKMAKST